MPSSFSTNKNFEEPASGSYNNAWGPVLNNVISEIDSSLGGNTAISVTGVGAGTITLSPAQYQPPNIVFSGTLTANLIYAVPSGVGGIWTISNATTGAFTLTFAVIGGGTYVLPQGQRTMLVCDGTNIALTQTPPTSVVSATFNATMLGVTGTVTVPCQYTVVSGATCILELNTAITAIQANGNGSTGLSISGIPSAAQPARENFLGSIMAVNSGTAYLPAQSFYTGSAQITFWIPSLTSPYQYGQGQWTATGLKGIVGGTLVYSVV